MNNGKSNSQEDQGGQVDRGHLWVLLYPAHTHIYIVNTHFTSPLGPFLPCTQILLTHAFHLYLSLPRTQMLPLLTHIFHITSGSFFTLHTLLTYIFYMNLSLPCTHTHTHTQLHTHTFTLLTHVSHHLRVLFYTVHTHTLTFCLLCAQW